MPLIPNWAPFDRKCNKDSGNCVSYIGLVNTNGKWFGDSGDVGNGQTDEEIKKLIATELKDVALFDFDVTLIFQGL